MDPSNLLTQLQRIRNSDDGEQLTTDEIEDQLITMVFAGHETTATALAFTWYVLATHPGHPRAVRCGIGDGTR